MTILMKSRQWLAGVLRRLLMELGFGGRKLNEAKSGPLQLEQIIGSSPTADKDAVIYDETTKSWKPQQIDALNLPIDGGTW